MIDPIQLLQYFAIFSVVYWLVILASSQFKFKKNQLGAEARYANRWEILNNFRTAKKQLNRPKVDGYCLYIGSFDRSILKGFKGFLAEVKVFITKKTPSLFVCYANTCLEVLGKAATGKTFLLNLLLVSVIKAFLPLGLYDNKAGSDGRDGQISFVAPYAKAHGYQIKVIAPGRDYSNAIVNLIQQVIKTTTDRTGAITIARGMHRCLRAVYGKTDGFFGPAGERLLAAAFLMAKNTDYPDLAMAFAILTLPDLTSRLAYAMELPDHPFIELWQEIGFKQLVSLEPAPKTASNIIAQGSDVILDLMQEDLLECFMGESNTDLYMSGKQMLVFVGDDRREDVIAPFLSSYISSLIAVNCSDYRERGLVLSLDEAGAVGHLDGLEKHSNRYRSKGLCTIISYQTRNQLYKWYGKEGAKEALASVGSHIWLNPGDLDTAKELSEYLGKKEVIVKSSSRSSSTKGGCTTTVSDQVREVPLKRPEEFTVDGRSVFTFINPAFAWKTFAHRPIEVKGYKVKKKDIDLQKKYQQAWFDEILPQLKRQNQAQKRDLSAELRARMKYAETILPKRPGPEKTTNSVGGNLKRTTKKSQNLSANKTVSYKKDRENTEDELDFMP